MQPITREGYENYLIPMKVTEVVRQMADFLIAMLFKPHKELGYVVDWGQGQALYRNKRRTRELWRSALLLCERTGWYFPRAY